jgi:hypothetical protein
MGGSTNLRLVRLRLFLTLITMFCIPIAITIPVVLGKVRGEGASLVLPTLIIIALSAGLGLLTVWLAHRVLEPAERLEQDLRSLERESLRPAPRAGAARPGRVQAGE